jgi:hypothetical protein
MNLNISIFVFALTGKFTRRTFTKFLLLFIRKGTYKFNSTISCSRSPRRVNGPFGPFKVQSRKRSPVQGAQLGPGDLRMGAATYAAIGSGDHVSWPTISANVMVRSATSLDCSARSVACLTIKKGLLISFRFPLFSFLMYGSLIVKALCREHHPP